MYLLIIGVPVAAAAMAVIVFAKGIASHSFKCKHCSKEFHIKWYQVFVTVHSDREYKLKCPFCDITDWCTEQSEDE